MSAPQAGCFVEVDGIEFEARDWAWESNALALADQWSVVLPAPEGKAHTRDGRTMRAGEFREGAPVKFFTRDPAVNGGALIQKLTGRLINIDDAEGRDGYQIRLSGFDLGWHLTTGTGRVFENTRGRTFKGFLEGNVLNADLGWGFAGVRGDNILNKRFRQGRAGVVASIQEDTSPTVTRFQIEVGEALAPKLIEYAKREGYLLNVSADGYLQFFQPVSSGEPDYFFHHHSASDPVGSEFNNVRNVQWKRTAEGLYTNVQCWNTVLFDDDKDPFDPNSGRYAGEFNNAGSLPFVRRLSFQDGDQIGDKATRRAQWQWQRGRFDSETITFRVFGHSQNGKAFEPDTIAYYRDEIRGLDGNYYVSAIRPARMLPPPGVNPDSGTYTDITLKPPGFLSA